MRSLAGFMSMLALGLLLGGIVMLTGRSPDTIAALEPGQGSPVLIDYRSLLIGLLLGVLLSNLARIPWSELPRRAVMWILNNERNLYRIVMAVLLITVLIFY